MVQIVQPEDEPAPFLMRKLRFLYFVILVTAIVVVYQLTFGEDTTSQSRLVYGGYGVPARDGKQHLELIKEEQVSENDSGGETIQRPQQNVVQKPQQDVVQEPPQNVVQEPPQDVVQEPPQNVVQEPQQNVVQEPQQNVVQEPPQGTFPPPQHNTFPQPQQIPSHIPVQQSQCPVLDMDNIHERILKNCGNVERYKNNWVELVAMYHIPPQHLLYDVDRNYVWVTVPKVASSNIKRVIIQEKFGYDKDSPEMEEAMSQPHVTLAKCCLLTDEVAREYYSLQRAFTFAFIRNPWTRLHSAYRDKILKFRGFSDYYYIKKILFTVREWSWAQVSDDAAVKEVAGTITFPEFLTMLARTDTESYNDHWKPWFLLTEPCMIKYDYIGYLEDIRTAYELIKEKLFADLDYLDLGERYTGSSARWETINAYKDVPKNVLNNIEEKFEDDFFIGGYSKDINCI